MRKCAEVGAKMKRGIGRSVQGQVWVETVLYTLIGIAIIGMVLSFAYPKIRAAQEAALVEQSITTLANLDEVITLVNGRGPGNVKTYTFVLKRGKLFIDGEQDSVLLELRGLSSDYSEPGLPVRQGRVEVLTTKEAKGYAVNVGVNYRMQKGLIDVKVGEKDTKKEFAKAATPYVLKVEYRQAQCWLHDDAQSSCESNVLCEWKCETEIISCIKKCLPKDAYKKDFLSIDEAAGI